MMSDNSLNQATNRKPRIFLSYARDDDEAFVKRVYTALKDDFDVWWDREKMPNRGLSFLQEIREAIDWADRLLLVMGPAVEKSDYVRQEYQYAYESYKGINIALRLGDYPDLPELLRNFDTLNFRADADFDQRLETLKRQLSESIAPIGALYGVPAMPDNFLPRPDAIQALQALVIDDVDKPTVISAEKRTTAVEGMGGIGKSAIATAFAHDRKVRFAFPDGIVWLTAGREPNRYELYRAVGVALGDDLSNYPDEAAARQKAQHALAEKRCLLILDDVWELSTAKAFRDLIVGTPARLLLTTRKQEINNLLNANEYRLKLIGKTQAVDYLRGWVGDDPDLAAIAQKLGYLFLALKLAGARMKRDGLSGQEYLQTFDRVSQVKLSRHAKDRDESLTVSIRLSVDAVFEEAAEDTLLYHSFGIFAEDTRIPQATILQFWGHLRPDIDASDLREILADLVDLALVERHEDRSITLHDLLHDYTREQLGERYIQTHQALLDSYGVAAWHLLPQTEPYLWHALGYHLLEAGQAETLRAALLDYCYLQAKLNATDPNALMADCDLLPDDDMIRLLKSAVSMSAHVISEDLAQWGSQLVGRLMRWLEKHADIRSLTDAIMQNVAGVYPTFPDGEYAPLLQAGGSLIRTLEGHTRGVSSVALSGEYAISGSGDKTLRVWNWQTGKHLHTLEGHTNTVTSVALSGEVAISGSHDHTLRVWNWQTGEHLRMLEGHTSYVWGVALSGEYAISGSEDKTLRVWNWQTGEHLRTLEGHTWGVNCVALSGEYAISGSYDTTLRVWNWQTGEPLHTLEGHTSRVNSVALSGKVAISGSDDNTLRVWNWQTGEQLHTLEGHTGPVNCVALSGEYAISGSWDKTLRVWNWQMGEHLRTLEGHTDMVISVALSGKYAISGSYDNTLRVWNWQTGEHLRTLEGHTSTVTSVALSGEVAISGSWDKTLRVWNWQMGEHLRTLEGHTSWVSSMALSGQYVISVSGEDTDHILNVWSWQTGKYIRTLEGNTWGGILGVNIIVLLDNYAISGSLDKTLRVWDWQTGEPLRTLKGHTNGVLSVALSGKYAVSGSDDETLRVWNWQTGKHLRTLEGHTKGVTSVALSGDIAISESSDETLRVWNWQTGEALDVYPDTSEGREQLLTEHPHLSQVAFAGYVPHESGWAVIRNRKRLTFRNPQGQTVGAFTAEAYISEVQMVDAGTVIAFDRTGRVLFLRWHPGAQEEA